MTLRVLVSRIDRVGDLVLTLPLCGLLKARAGAHVTVLARTYTRDVAAACDRVDDVLSWDTARSPAERRRLVAGARADVVLHVRPDVDVARAAWAARVPTRIGTSRRAYHWLFCNRLEAVARRASDLHEAQLNVRLARTLLDTDALALSPAQLAPFGRLTPRVPVPAALAPLVASDRFTLVLHPRSGGSAGEWPLAAYAQLIAALASSRYRVLVTGTPADGVALRAWFAGLPEHVHDLTGQTDVASLLALLAAADGIVASSTGPLHLAAALGTRALGLFSDRPPAHPGRWGPIGARAEVIVPEVACDRCERGTVGPDDPCRCVAAIPVPAVVARVERWVGEDAAERAAVVADAPEGSTPAAGTV